MLDTVDMDGVGAEWGDDLQLVSSLAPTSSDHCHDAASCHGCHAGMSAFDAAKYHRSCICWDVRSTEGSLL